MLKRLPTTVVALAALAALVLGGSAIASAQAGHAKKHHAVRHHRVHNVAAPVSSGTDADNVQSGDQTAPDSGTAAAESGSETASETAGESAGASDGPGYQDPAGTNADHQFQGQE